MNKLNRLMERSAGQDLMQLVEPLASYICAMEQPQAVLLSALAVLFKEIETTNRAAVAQFRTYREN